MNAERVKSIMKSKGVINVQYKGRPVWIENMPDDNTAEVSCIQSRTRMEVPVVELDED